MSSIKNCNVAVTLLRYSVFRQYIEGVFFMKGKKTLITGGTGTWGEMLIEALIKEQANEITVFSRNENMQVNIMNKFRNQTVKMIVGDIKDITSLEDACKGVDIIFHLAALKHVPIFKQQIKVDNIIKITDKRMMRFFIPVDEAIEEVIRATKISKGGEIFIMHMPAFKIQDIAEVILETYAKESGTIKEVGLRLGAKKANGIITIIQKSE